MSISFDEASHCPRCDNKGLEVSRSSKPTVVMLECKTEICRWFETRWPVQLMDDGSVYDRSADHSAPEKQFPKLDLAQKIRAQQYLDRLGN